MNRKVLLVSANEVIGGSFIEDNVDVKLLSKVVSQVQDLHLKPILGDVLFYEVLGAIYDSTVNHTQLIPLYVDLLEVAKPYLINKVVAEFVILNNYKFTGKGLLKLNDNSATSLNDSDLQNVKNYYDNVSTGYKIDIVNFLKKNNLIDGSTDENITSDATGWFLSSIDVHNTSTVEIPEPSNYIDTYVTGATYNEETSVLTFTNNRGGSFGVAIDASGGNAGASISGFTFSPSANTLTIIDITGGTFSVAIESLSGLTVANALSATTFYGDGSNLTGIHNYYTTGATLNSNTISFDRNNQLSAYTVNLSSLNVPSILGYTPENAATKGQALGYVPLNASIKIDTTYLPDSLLGNVNYKGTWNPSTNTPALSAASATKGYYFIASTSGTYSGISFDTGDWVISNGATWEKVDNTDALISFNGRIGNITLLSTDVTTALGYTPANVSGTLSQLASTTSSQLASVITDETGSGSLVFASSPTLVSPILGTPQSVTLTNATGLPLSTGITGVLPSVNGGAGSINGLLKANGSGTVSQAVASTDYLLPSGAGYSTTNGDGFALTTSTLSSGNLVSLVSTGTGAASNTQTVLNVSTSGANATSNQTTYGLRISNTHTGTGSINYAGYFNAAGGSQNYSIVVGAGVTALKDLYADGAVVLGSTTANNGITIRTPTQTYTIQGYNTGTLQFSSGIVCTGGGFSTFSGAFDAAGSGVGWSARAGNNVNTQNCFTFNNVQTVNSPLATTRLATFQYFGSERFGIDMDGWTIAPAIRGGDAANSFITYKSTSASGTSTGSAHRFFGGNNGSVGIMTMLNDGRIGIGTASPSTNALVEISSTTKGFLPPRMTTSQRTAITSVEEGLCVYDTDLHKLYVYDGTVWQAAW